MEVKRTQEIFILDVVDEGQALCLKALMKVFSALESTLQSYFVDALIR